MRASALTIDAHRLIIYLHEVHHILLHTRTRWSRADTPAAAVNSSNCSTVYSSTTSQIISTWALFQRANEMFMRTEDSSTKYISYLRELEHTAYFIARTN